MSSASVSSSIGTRSKRTKEPPVTTTAAAASPPPKRARTTATTTPPTEEESTAGAPTATATTTATTNITTTATGPAPSTTDSTAPHESTAPATTTGTSSLDPTDPAHFNTFLFELLLFRAQAGNYHVAKETHPNLHAWMQFLKKEYKQHTTIGTPTTTTATPTATAANTTGTSNPKDTTNNPSSFRLTNDQVKVLEYLHVPLTSRGEDHWKRFYELLVQYKERHGHVLVPRLCEIPGLGDWVTDQRRQYKSWKQGQSSQMTPARRELLESIGFQWQVRNRPEWEHRYQELTDYKQKHGDCKVPQHYKENKALGKWVAKQREQFKLMKKGQHTFLTPYRLEKLNALGFSWQVRTSFDGTEGAETALGESKDSGSFAAAAKIKTEDTADAPTFAWEHDTAKQDDKNDEGGDKKTKIEDTDAKSSSKQTEEAAATITTEDTSSKSLPEEETEKPSLAAQV